MIKRKLKAFTLIELLTVVAIIAMLIAIFGVGMRKVKIIQRNLQQKAALKSMEVGIHLFSADFKEYPDSDQISDGSTVVTGAQRLAEVLLGRDELGFHPRSKWHPQLDIAEPAPHPGLTTYTSQTKKDRKPQYIELGRQLGVYTIYELWAGNNGNSDIYESGAVTPNGTYRAPVITDVFNRNKATLPSGDNVKVGMPVLYYKADSTKRFRVDRSNQPVTNPDYAEYKDWIYNYADNVPILQLPWLRDPADPLESGDIPPHYPDEDNDGDNHAQVFYEILSRRHTPGTNWDKPYNPSTFILISAGYDGIYGTKDDIANFDY